MSVTPLEAALLGDQIEHTSAFKGLLAGLVVGFLVTGALLLAAGATVATGGAAAVVIGALIAGTAGGGLAGMKIGSVFTSKKGPINTGSPDTFIGNHPKPAARAIKDTVACSDHSLKFIATGSLDVYINMQPAARKTDKTECDGKICEFYPDVFFGGPTGQYLDIESEVPGWLVTTLEIAALVGTVIATGGAILTVGIGAALGGLGASLVGGWVGGKVGGAIGGHFFGEKGQVIGEVAGEFLLSNWAGNRGAKLGGALEARLPTSTLARMPGATPEHIAARQQVARDFYESSPNFRDASGNPDVARIESHMSGIDFTKPVRVREITEPTQLAQFQAKGDPWTGNYIAEPNTRPTELGIGELGRAADGSIGPKVIQMYEVPAGTKVLQSTASPKVDSWSVGAKETSPGSGIYTERLVQNSTGGGQQMFIGDKGVMTPVGGQQPVDPALLSPGTPTGYRPGTTTTGAPPALPTGPSGVPVRGDGAYTPVNVGGTGGVLGVGMVGPPGTADPTKP